MSFLHVFSPHVFILSPALPPIPVQHHVDKLLLRTGFFGLITTIHANIIRVDHLIFVGVGSRSE